MELREVPETGGRYAVSADGRVFERGRVVTVRGVPKGVPQREMPLHVMDSGYAEVRLTGGKRWLVHVLVARVWLGPQPAGRVVDHIDGDRLNNRVTNLRYLTQVENVRVGRSAKLDERRAERIRRKVAERKVTQEQVAAEEGISQQQVSRIVRGEAWR